MEQAQEILKTILFSFIPILTKFVLIYTKNCSKQYDKKQKLEKNREMEDNSSDSNFINIHERKHRNL